VLLEDNATAYIVRVWVERREVEDAPVAWRGSIEQVASDRIKYLTDLDEIARFIRPFLEALGVTFGKPIDGYVGHAVLYDQTSSDSAQENPGE